MDNNHVNTTWRQYCSPWMFSIYISHLPIILWLEDDKTSPCYLNIRYVLVVACNWGWTPLITDRASPLDFTFWLDTKKHPIHPAPSPRVALDQAVCDCTYRVALVCPEGDAGRTIPYDLVERLRFDGACKVHCIDSRESTQFISTGADMPLPGLFCFCWGKKQQQILYSLSRLKNWNRLFLAGARLRLHVARAMCPSRLASRLKALRVAERIFVQRGVAHE